MRLDLLETHQVEQLSACSLSLLLGVFTKDNKIERYFRVARALLNVDNVAFAFHNEPYIWAASTSCDFKAYIADTKQNLSNYFEDQLIIAAGHPHYPSITQLVSTLGVNHQRLLCYDFRLESGESIGQILFYDQQDVEFTEKQKSLLIELTSGLVTILQHHHASEDYHELYEQEQALNFSKTKFLQIIAHDLRAPFHGLIGFSDVLVHERDTLNNQDIQNIASYLHDTLQSTYSLLENLLNWAMAEGGRFVYHPINFKLKQATKIVFDVLNGLAIKKNIELIDRVPDDISVFADINMITSVVQNLVSNALKFTHTDGSGKVIIAAAIVERGIEISIQDTGLGMTKSQLEQVFEPQIKASFKGTKGEKGTGLGLVLCKRFVDLNQGKIDVSSVEGRGTTFRVTLPLAKNTHHALMVCKEKPQVEQTEVLPTL